MLAQTKDMKIAVPHPLHQLLVHFQVSKEVGVLIS